ncbi:MAG: hypothetical protein AAB544_04460 [Patescibacteria group bacterium]
MRVLSFWLDSKFHPPSEEEILAWAHDPNSSLANDEWDYDFEHWIFGDKTETDRHLSFILHLAVDTECRERARNSIAHVLGLHAEILIAEEKMEEIDSFLKTLSSQSDQNLDDVVHKYKEILSLPRSWRQRAMMDGIKTAREQMAKAEKDGWWSPDKN